MRLRPDAGEADTLSDDEEDQQSIISMIVALMIFTPAGRSLTEEAETELPGWHRGLSRSSCGTSTLDIIRHMENCRRRPDRRPVRERGADGHSDGRSVERALSLRFGP